MTPEARNSRKTPRRHDGVVDTLGEHLRQRTPTPAEEQVALGRIWTDLREEDVLANVLREFQPAIQPGPGTRRSAGVSARPSRIALAAAAGVVLLLSAALVGYVVSTRPVEAGVEAIDGTLYRVSGSDARVLAAGDRVRTNEILRTNGGAGAQLALRDGSRVEMRSQSELALERADDGVRVRLTRGSIIVNAAKQRAGHLYVQTKDVTVSVVGTVFMVNAEKAGSRVAVIEGEVHVKQGATEQKLLPGQQMVTSALMTAPTIPQEIAWSRNAQVLRALLQQSTVVAPAAPAGNSGGRLAFDVESIRPSVPGAGGRGGGLPAYHPYTKGCTGFVELDPRRFVMRNVTLLTLIMRAHGAPDRTCASFTTELLSGGPAWTDSDQFDVQTVIPLGSPAYTVRQFENNRAPALQRMLQTMLAERFKLVLRRETKEMPVEALTLGTTRDATQLAELAALTMSRSPRKAEWAGLFDRAAKGTESLKEGTISTEGEGLWGINASMPELVSYLARLTGRPVMDRTGLTLQFAFDLQYERVPDGLPGIQGFGRPLAAASLASLRRALREQLGLELESGTAPVEVLVIERAEKPSPN